jgi:hypothetical protein
MEHEQRYDRARQVEHEHLLSAYAGLFVQRSDTYARQVEGKRSYYRVKRPDGTPVPLTRDTLIKHLTGEITIGLSGVDPLLPCRWDSSAGDHRAKPLALHWRQAPVARQQRCFLFGHHLHREAVLLCRPIQELGLHCHH